ncbi:hypothetical protein [Candidatus Kuenenia sp.]|uniref:hypothetical protein n=1 Tax=Candidatus Kuenenia sp. TaxID=2499824 RepID=UPI00321FB5E9
MTRTSPHSADVITNMRFVYKSIRFAIYTVFFTAGILSLPILAERKGGATFKEGGPVEWAQLVLLIFSAGLFGIGAWRAPAWRGLLCLFVFLVSLVVARELDSVLDRCIPVFGWKVPAGVLILSAALCVWRYRKTLPCQVHGFIEGYPFPILWFGLLTVIVCAQSVGHGRLLDALMLSDYVRNYKRMVEELIELCGYFFIWVGSMEMVIYALTGLPPFKKIQREI